MSEEFVLGLARDAVFTMLLMAAPMLFISLLVGLAVSVFQATTQIQEQTLTFVPKVIAVFLSVLVFGPWMLNLIITFTLRIFNEMSIVIR